MRKRKKISKIAIIIALILVLVLIGDIIGALLYLSLPQTLRESLITYVTTGEALTFFQIFYQQFLSQLAIWSFGLLIIGNIINLFFIFVRGVSAGFNLAFLLDGGISSLMFILWIIHYTAILSVTILSVYFSLRFSYLVVKSCLKKKYKLVKKHLNQYVMQLILILVLTILTSFLSFSITPVVTEQLDNNYEKIVFKI